jgi:NitT/TauT family transport system substrate-binding protein
MARGAFLARAAALGLSAAVAERLFAHAAEAATLGQANRDRAAAAAKGLNLVRWMSPRGTLDVVDDYPNWVAQEMGYFRELGIESQLNAGPIDATAGPKAVASGAMDMSYPSPGVFSLVLAAGLPVQSVWEMGAFDVFDFAVRVNSPYKSIKDLAGKTILLGSAGWQGIADPEFAQVGVNVKTLHYEAAGQQWGQALKAGKGDAALSWEGLRAQWDGTGLRFRYFRGSTFSKFPANSFVIRAKDLSSLRWVDIYTRYLRGWAMGLEFGHINPAAATQIVYKYRPALAHTLKPTMGVESTKQLAAVFRGNWAHRQQVSGLSSPWGWHDLASWDTFFATAHKIGQLAQMIQAQKVITNSLVAGANKFDHARVRSDAMHFKMSKAFSGM